MATKITSLHQIYQFKLTLLATEPAIWRRILVPKQYSFWDLHVALQDAMGWCDYHLHEFRVRNQGIEITIGIPEDDGFQDDEEIASGWETKISEYFNSKGDTAEYIYDFGDNWRHQLVLEEVIAKQKNVHYPLCTDGQGACPPEDCGSIPGYQRLLKIIADPKHEEYDNMKMWLNNHVIKYWPYKPDFFDPKKVKFDDPQERWDRAFAEQH